MRTFLGLVGYYRQFVPQFASIAAPLHELTAKNQPNQVRWTAEMEAAFQQLKTTLCTGPVLATPDFTKQFVLQTDASEVGIGAVLSQVRDNIEHPLMYISRKLLKHERNYATIEKVWQLDGH